MDRQSNVEHVVTELQHGRETQVSSPPTLRLDQWLAALIAHAGSDLMLIPGAPPCIRFEGQVRAIDGGALNGPEIEAALVPPPTPPALKQYPATHIAYCSYHFP